MSDTSEITSGCLIHYDSRHIQVRADFMGICQYSREEYKDKRKKEPNQECMAKILRLLETLTDHAKAEWKLKTMKAEEKGLAKPKEPECYPIELSNGVLVRLMYYTFGESTVRNSLSYLLEIGYIGYSQEKRNDRPHIWLEQEHVQSLLKLQAQVILAGYEFRPPSYQGAISYPSDAISNPRTPISYPEPPKIDPSGCESTDNNISNKKDDTSEKDKKESIATSLEVALHTSNVRDIEVMRKRKTEPRLPAVHLTIETPYQYHIANSDYEKDDDFDADAHEREMIAAFLNADTVKVPAIPKHTPDAGEPLSLAADPPVSRQDDAASGQAISSFSPSQDAAQRTITAPNGAVQASIPKRPRAKKAVTQAKVPAITLTEQQQAFWALWCAVWFNVDIAPSLNETAYGHVKTLAPHITTQEQMNSLEKHARKRLLEQSGISRKEVQLGNCANSYQSWIQTQQQAPKPQNGPVLGGYYLLGEAM